MDFRIAVKNYLPSATLWHMQHDSHVCMVTYRVCLHFCTMTDTLDNQVPRGFLCRSGFWRCTSSQGGLWFPSLPSPDSSLPQLSQLVPTMTKIEWYLPHTVIFPAISLITIILKCYYKLLQFRGFFRRYFYWILFFMILVYFFLLNIKFYLIVIRINIIWDE